MEQSATFKKKKKQTKIENEVLRFQRKKYFEICMYYKNQKAIKKNIILESMRML